MACDISTWLWPDGHEAFFRDRRIEVLQQSGEHCVATMLATLAGRPIEYFAGRVNTQDPVSWSDALRPFGMKLAYCPTDVRQLRFYLPELLAIDDLFLLCYYTASELQMLGDPDDDGWLCGSHVVALHRDRILDTVTGTAVPAIEHACNNAHTKRIFRVVPADHPRGL